MKGAIRPLSFLINPMKYFHAPGFWPSDYVRGERLGRYEYSQGNSQKFYHVMVDTAGNYWAFYGRLGASNPQCRRFANSAQAADVLSEKRQKGYVFVPGSTTAELECLKARQEALDRSLPPAQPEPALTSRRPRL
jgi:predicted DNA-binding WGR domain protein